MRPARWRSPLASVRPRSSAGRPSWWPHGRWRWLRPPGPVPPTRQSWTSSATSQARAPTERPSPYTRGKSRRGPCAPRPKRRATAAQSRRLGAAPNAKPRRSVPSAAYWLGLAACMRSTASRSDTKGATVRATIAALIAGLLATSLLAAPPQQPPSQDGKESHVPGRVLVQMRVGAAEPEGVFERYGRVLLVHVPDE